MFMDKFLGGSLFNNIVKLSLQGMTTIIIIIKRRAQPEVISV
jgi:hypothetical protein